MNAIVERLAPATKVKPPLEIQIESLKREVRALKKALKEERRHSIDMLAIMRRMSVRSEAFVRVLEGCNCSQCTCTPTRSEMLARRE
jgi:hypothetical protein